MKVSDLIHKFQDRNNYNSTPIVYWYKTCYAHKIQNASISDRFSVFEITSDALIKAGLYKEALDLINSMLSNQKKLTVDQVAIVYSVECRLYSLIDSWEFAEESYLKTYSLLPRVKSPKVKAELLLTLAEMKRRSQKGGWIAYKLLYLTKELVTKEQLGNGLMARIHDRLSATFDIPIVQKKLNLQTIDSMYKHADLSRYFALKSNSIETLASAYNLLGGIKSSMSEKDSSLYYFEQATQIWMELGDKRSMALGLLNQSLIYHDRLDYSQEKILLDSIYRMVEGTSWGYERRHNFFLLSQNAEVLGQLDSALFWYRKMKSVDDSLTNNFLSQRDEIVRSKFEVNKMKSQILKQDEEIKLKTEDTKRLVVYIVLLVLLAIATGLVMVRFRYFNRKSREYSKELSAINGDLKTVLSEKEVLFQELHHRVKNNLAMLSGLLEIQRSKTSNEQTQKELSETIGRISTISDIHKNVYQNEVLGEISVIPLMQEMIEHQRSMLLSEENHTLTFNWKEQKMDVSLIVPFSLIFNEILTNAVKYGLPTKECRIHIDLIVSEETCELLVSDSGPGIPDDLDLNNTMGLYLVQLLCSSIDATLDWKQEDVFKVSVKIPLTNEA